MPKQTFCFGAIVTLSVEADNERTAQALADKAMQSFESRAWEYDAELEWELQEADPPEMWGDEDEDEHDGCVGCGYSFGNVERDGQQHDYCVACAENAENARDAH